MLILALDTSGRVASAALCRDQTILALERRDSMMDHSRTILPVCRDMLAAQGLGLSQIDVFAATKGPGSFTGVRIGVSAVKGFGWALDKPCAGVSTLESAAYAARDWTGVLCALVHARENEYFTALFQCQGGRVTRMSPDAPASAAEILAGMPQGAALCGDGAGEFTRRNGPDCGRLGLTDRATWQDAAGTALCAQAMAGRGELCSCHELTPAYLRIPQAERVKLEEEKRKKEGKES